MKKWVFVMMMSLLGCGAQNNTISTNIYKTNSSGLDKQIGTVRFSGTDNGVFVQVNLQGLPPGAHGFHIHENPSCDAAPDASGKMQPAQAAGGHYDPDMTGVHLGPEGMGHKGDMPVLMADADGNVVTEFYLPHISLDEIKNHSVIVHAGGDNYADTPLPLGGGGARIACGIIKE